MSVENECGQCGMEYQNKDGCLMPQALGNLSVLILMFKKKYVA